MYAEPRCSSSNSPKRCSSSSTRYRSSHRCSRYHPTAGLPISTPVFLLNYVSFAMICKPSPEGRARIRPSVERARERETAESTAVRATTPQQDLSSAISVVVVTVAVNTAAAKRIRKNFKVCTPHKFHNPS